METTALIKGVKIFPGATVSCSEKKSTELQDTSVTELEGGIKKSHVAQFSTAPAKRWDQIAANMGKS
ncbi:UNVERIFIED_CONTAM: hypothetical protein HDU68_011714 [Siphonaria sp. JEL0065]|nr:hypothetical protein HDU68_011714 [Siphonaria sp. JEL0065]